MDASPGVPHNLRPKAIGEPLPDVPPGTSCRPDKPVLLLRCREDEALRKRLETHLSILHEQGLISGWHDGRIEAGTEWDGAISENLEHAGIILLLVSADFLASSYIRDVEIAGAMKRHQAGTARVIPVILRPVDWHSAPFGNLEAASQGRQAGDAVEKP